MTEAQKAQYREYVERWKIARPLLEAQREEDVRRSDTISNIASFGRLWKSAVRDWPPTDSSGLVEQQRIFMKAPRLDGRPHDHRAKRC